MADPAGGPAETKKGECRIGRQGQNPGGQGQTTVDRRFFAQQLVGRGCQSQDQLQRGIPRCQLGGQPEQLPGAWIALRVEALTETRDVFAAPQSSGNHLARPRRGTDFVEQGFHPPGVPPVPAAEQSVQPTGHRAVKRGIGRGNAARGEGRNVELVIHTEDQSGFEQAQAIGRHSPRPAQPRDHTVAAFLFAALFATSGEGSEEKQNPRSRLQSAGRSQVESRGIVASQDRQQGLGGLEWRQWLEAATPGIHFGRPAGGGKKRFCLLGRKAPDQGHRIFEGCRAGQGYGVLPAVIKAAVDDRGDGRFEQGPAPIERAFERLLDHLGGLPFDVAPAAQSKYVGPAIAPGPRAAVVLFGFEQATADVGVKRFEAHAEQLGRFAGRKEFGGFWQH